MTFFFQLVILFCPVLAKLQRKTLIPTQIVGYALTLLVGVTIVLLAFQLYADLQPMLTQQTDVFKAHTVTVSKNVTLFKTANKEGVYFDQRELDRIQQQDFVKKVSRFTSSSFNVSASINLGDGHRMSTDLFFESVPDEYLDVQSDAWQWDSTSDFLPIVIPEDYLSLYNFGFAESQSLPVISQNTLSQVSFNIVIDGNGRHRMYTSRIVGFSGKINSILVPEDFLVWANRYFGAPSTDRCSRLLVEFTDASDERIPAFFEGNGLNINKSELETSKMVFIFRFALLFVFVIAAIIIALSMAFIVMSLNLIVQKNRDLFVNLYNIGYSTSQIARFYQRVVSIITVADLLLAVVAALVIRGLYVSRLQTIFSVGGGTLPIILTASILCLFLLLAYNGLIRRSVRSVVR